MTAAQRAKQHGTTLADMVRVSGLARRTLVDWAQSDHHGRQFAFDAVAKAVALKPEPV